jgi:hypothetical protein
MHRKNPYVPVQIAADNVGWKNQSQAWASQARATHLPSSVYAALSVELLPSTGHWYLNSETNSSTVQNKSISSALLLDLNLGISQVTFPFYNSVILDCFWDPTFFIIIQSQHDEMEDKFLEERTALEDKYQKPSKWLTSTIHMITFANVVMIWLQSFIWSNYINPCNGHTYKLIWSYLTVMCVVMELLPQTWF